MINQDTIRLLRECDAGIKMGVSSIDDVFEYVGSDDFKKALKYCKNQHVQLKEEIQELLDKYEPDDVIVITVERDQRYMEKLDSYIIQDSGE